MRTNKKQKEGNNVQFDYTTLTGRIKRTSSLKDVARALDITYPTLSRRLAGEPFKTDELIKLSELLNIDTNDSEEMHRYFFTIKSSHLSTVKL